MFKKSADTEMQLKRTGTVSMDFTFTSQMLIFTLLYLLSWKPGGFMWSSLFITVFTATCWITNVVALHECVSFGNENEKLVLVEMLHSDGLSCLFDFNCFLMHRTLVSVFENVSSRSSETSVWSNQPSVRSLRCVWRWFEGSMMKKVSRYG